MASPAKLPSSVYQHPRYYAIGYQWNTSAECDFLQRCLTTYGPAQGKRALDIGCGAGRHMLELARRGFRVSGFDLYPEMVAYLREEAKNAGIDLTVSVGDLRTVPVPGTFDLAFCLMDTFRFLLTNEEILAHLRAVGERLAPGGLYVTDFWIPTRWDQAANEIYQWEQTEDGTTVRVLYLQHPETVDPVEQTFEDELVFVVQEGEHSREIRGERTRTRLILPQEFRALVEASGAFEVAGLFSEFDAGKPLSAESLSWRMVSVLKKRG